MNNVTEAHLDQLVKARWLAIGLSQSDLAEVLGAAFKQTPADGDTSRAAAGRLMQIACSLQSLLDLRLLRAFRELQDHRSKRMLIHLAERIARRQATRRGDAG